MSDTFRIIWQAQKPVNAKKAVFLNRLGFNKKVEALKIGLADRLHKLELFNNPLDAQIAMGINAWLIARYQILCPCK
jgi:hypothetical protein